MRTLALLLFLLIPWRAQAEVAVLIHGYLSNAATWEWSGVNARLRAAGWREGGNFAFSPIGLIDRTTTATDGDVFYTVDLPSLAPASVQAAWLAAALDRIQTRHPGEKITLVGHSAGGVVARLVLVRRGAGAVHRLITIASPHLGTHRAIQALDAVDDDGFFGPFKEWVVRNEIGDGLYRTLELSRGILMDLLPPKPGTLLYWLNLQPHPDIEYVSVVRSGGYWLPGDLLVPAVSQDMNRVPALRGRSAVHLSLQGHALSPADGVLLARLL